MADALLHLLQAAGLEADERLMSVLETRRDIFEATAVTEVAALTPNEPGGLPHGLRAALAARMARHNSDEAMAAYYAGKVEGAQEERLADPCFGGDDDVRSHALVRHVDMVTMRPEDATRGDVEALIAAGWSEPDIVRLSELIAFVNYQLRVAAGLRLMGDGRWAGK